MSQRPTLYLACALTQAPPEFVAGVEDVRAKLKASYEVLEFLGLVKGTAADAYRWDIHECVAKADAIVAICDYPSIGLGYELGTAIEKLHKPVLGVAQESTRVTRLILGVDAPHFAFERYQTMNDIPALVAAFLKTRHIG